MKKYQKHSYLLLSSALLLSSIAPSMTYAEETKNSNEKANVGLIEGEFTLKTSEPVGFGSHIIESQKKTVTTGFEGDFGVIDARGTQEGWNVTVSASPFTIVEPENGWVKENPYQLPTGSLSLASLNDVKGVNGEPTKVTPSIDTVDTVIDMNEAIKIATADVGKGMGEYALTYKEDALSLVIDPLTAKIDTINYPDTVTPYESTITWDLISGPTENIVTDNTKMETFSMEYDSENAPETITYSENGYIGELTKKGELTKVLVSGEYIAADTKNIEEYFEKDNFRGEYKYTFYESDLDDLITPENLYQSSSSGGSISYRYNQDSYSGTLYAYNEKGEKVYDYDYFYSNYKYEIEDNFISYLNKNGIFTKRDLMNSFDNLEEFYYYTSPYNYSHLYSITPTKEYGDMEFEVITKNPSDVNNGEEPVFLFKGEVKRPAKDTRVYKYIQEYEGTVSKK